MQAVKEWRRFEEDGFAHHAQGILVSSFEMWFPLTSIHTVIQFFGSGPCEKCCIRLRVAKTLESPFEVWVVVFEKMRFEKGFIDH